MVKPLNRGALRADTTPAAEMGLYERIRLATVFLERIDDNDEIRALENGEETIKYYKGEARFLRAYYYWLMMKRVGPVRFYSAK